MNALILSFIPESLRRDADEFRRARLVVSVSWTLLFASLALTIQSIVMNIPWIFVAIWLLGAALSLYNPFLLRNTASLRLTGNLIVSLSAIAIFLHCYILNDGLRLGLSQYFFVAIPLLAALFNGARQAIAWTAISFVLVLILFAANALGVAFPPVSIPPELMLAQRLLGTTSTLLLISLLSVQSIRAKDNALDLAVQTRAEAERKAEEDYQSLKELKASSEDRAAEDLRRSEEQKQYLTTSVETLLRHIRQIADGDLTVRVPIESSDDIGKLATTLNQTIGTIEQMLARVADSADRTMSAVVEISGTTEALASSSNRQSSQAGQVATAVEEMSTTIEGTTQQTSLAAHEASLANEDALSGNATMQAMMTNVRSISDVVITTAERITALGKSSEQIGEIVEVIDEIADQTNLLALNAAIEAARAGEQGRGFAVVADEVRKLAERTQKATKEISARIKIIQNDTADAVGSMGEGTRLVKEGEQAVTRTAEAFAAILQRTERVSDVMSQLAGAAEEQAATSNSMAQSVNDISTVIEESSRGVSNIADSTAGLKLQADELRQLIAQFRIQRLGSTGRHTQPLQSRVDSKRLLA
ncbi:MAG: HAMP domain-containing protein [Ignavibacteria bacterium]|nr:HAMP domain-containing protein [Ignavibacteria bacterium]